MMQRHMLGVIALGLLVAGGYLYWQGRSGGDWTLVAGACLRTGMVSGAVWLAWPQLQFLRRAPMWAWGVLLLATAVLIYRPKLLLLLGPLLAALAALYWFGRPRRPLA